MKSAHKKQEEINVVLLIAMFVVIAVMLKTKIIPQLYYPTTSWAGSLLHNMGGNGSFRRLLGLDDVTREGPSGYDKFSPEKEQKRCLPP